jgi:hypothetical protein
VRHRRLLGPHARTLRETCLSATVPQNAQPRKHVARPSVANLSAVDFDDWNQLTHRAAAKHFATTQTSAKKMSRSQQAMCSFALISNTTARVMPSGHATMRGVATADSFAMNT